MSSDDYFKANVSIELIENLNKKSTKLASHTFKIEDLELNKEESFQEEMKSSLPKKPILHFQTLIHQYYYVELKSTPTKTPTSFWKSKSESFEMDAPELKLVGVNLDLDTNKSPKLTKVDSKRTMQNLDRKYKGYQVNFNSVFTNPHMKSGFLLHLKMECNFAVNKMGLGDDLETVHQFEDICHSFIEPNQRQTINISGKIRNHILKIYEKQKDLKEWHYKDMPIQVLEEARFCIFNDLKYDAFPRFINSEEGYNMINKLRDDENVITTNSLYSVIHKIMDSFMVQKFDNIKEIEEYAFNLSNSQLLRENYLSYDWSKVKNFENKLKKVFKKEGNTKDESNNSSKNFAGKMKIKMVMFVKSGYTQKKNGLFDFLSPFYLKMKSESEDLVTESEFKTTLMIGPFLLEWSETELCIPRLELNETPIMSFDLGEIPNTNGFDEISLKLADEIVRWNTTMKFKTCSLDKEKYGNSQDFVDSILKALDIKLNIPEPTKNFLDKMREFGSSKLEFTMDSAFRNKFETNTDVIIFKTHEEIDQFMLKLLIKEPKFKTLYSGHFHLLKCFDRTFWMKEMHLKNQISSLKIDIENNENEKEKNLLARELIKLEETLDSVKGKFVKLCPFEDPTRSFSIVPMKSLKPIIKK